MLWCLVLVPKTFRGSFPLKLVICRAQRCVVAQLDDTNISNGAPISREKEGFRSFSWVVLLSVLAVGHPILHPASVHAKCLMWGWRLRPGNRH